MPLHRAPHRLQQNSTQTANCCWIADCNRPVPALNGCPKIVLRLSCTYPQGCPETCGCSSPQRTVQQTCNCPQTLAAPPPCRPSLSGTCSCHFLSTSRLLQPSKTCGCLSLASRASQRHVLTPPMQAENQTALLGPPLPSLPAQNKEICRTEA
jgi:hypothetical protein